MRGWSWLTGFGSGSSSYSFSIFQTPFGTSPTASQAQDTINFTSTGGTITITGDAGAKTVNFESIFSIPILISQGGTGLTSFTQGDLPYYTSGTALSKLAKSTSATRYLSNQGIDNAPSWNQVNIANGVTGILPIANGGTNSSTALSNNRVIQSSSGSIVEAAAITAARALISDANGIPTHSTVTSTELGYVSGVTSAIQTQINSKQATLTGSISGTANQVTVSANSNSVASNITLSTPQSIATTSDVTFNKVTATAALYSGVVALTDAASITTDASLGNMFTVVLGGNRTLETPTNPTNGQKCTWRIRQDGTGSRTLAFSAAFRFGNSLSSITLSTTANKTDYIGAIYNSTDSKWDIVSFSDGY